MKTTFLLTLFALLAASVSGLGIDDDLLAFWKKNSAQYTSSRLLGPVAGWPGFETAVVATDAAFSKPPFLMVLRRTSGAVIVPVAAIESSSSMLLDIDGNGTLDAKTGRSVVPGWVALKIPGPRSNGQAFRALSDRIYRQYNQDRGPVPAQLSLLVDELRKQAVDPQVADRDLAAALLFALDQGAEPILAVGTLAALALESKNRGASGPLAFLFLGEALETGGFAEGQSAYDRLIELDPASLIGAYKKARVDTNRLAAFIKAHPDFWALRQ